MMSRLAKEPKTNQIFNRKFADNKAEECGRGINLPKEEGRGK